MRPARRQVEVQQEQPAGGEDLRAQIQAQEAEIQQLWTTIAVRD